MGNALKKTDKHEKSLNLIFNSWTWKFNKETLFCSMTLTKLETGGFRVGECGESKRV